MKKIASLIMVAFLVFGIFAACNSKPDSPIIGTGEFEDLYSGIEEAPVSEYTPEEIKATYTVMCDKLENTTSAQSGTSEKVALFSSHDLDSETDDNIFNPADYHTTVPAEIAERFYILKEFAEAGFEKFCNQYAILGKDTLIRIRINNDLQELELSLKTENTYIFYSNYYLNDKGQKHLEYLEGDTLCVEYHNITYAVENNKATFPITYFRSALVGTQGYTLNTQADIEEMEITELYDALKYPFIKHIDSRLIQSLLNSSSATIIGERQFRNAADKTLYNFNYVGEFDIGGVNFSGEELPVTLADDKLFIGSDKYQVRSAAPSLFFCKNGGLYIWVYFTTIDREATEEGIKTVVDSMYNAYLISKNVKRTDDGVEFDLEKEIDLSKPAYSLPSHTENTIGTPDDEFIAHEEVVSCAIDGFTTCHYAVQTSENKLLFLVDF